MKPTIMVGIIVAVVVIIGIGSVIAFSVPTDMPIQEVSSEPEAENNTGKFFKVELKESISAKSKP